MNARSLWWDERFEGVTAGSGVFTKKTIKKSRPLCLKSYRTFCHWFLISCFSSMKENS